MHAARIILRDAADFNLFETPLRQDGVRSGQITSKHLVSEPHSGRKRMYAPDMAALTGIVHDFDYPVIMRVPDHRVTIARNFMIEFGDRRRDWM